MTSSKALFYFCISTIIGILLQSIIKIPQAYTWGILISGILIIATSLIIGRRSFIILGFCILFLILGVIRLQISEFNIENDTLKKLNDSPKTITLLGQTIGEPDTRSSYQKLKIEVNDMGSIVLVTTGRYPEYHYLDKVKITGKLKTPPEFEDFNYKNYLLKDGIYSVIDFPKIELVSREHDYNAFSFLYEKVLFLKEKLRKSIDLNFSSPQNSILDGIVFGNDKNMPKDLKDKFNATGLSHITAVSGGNIVILISILMSFLLFLGLWRSHAFYISIIFIWVYIILVGFPASGVRAAIMGSILLLAEILGRQNTSSRIIMLAGSLMLFQNPFLLFYDVGFQLSFLASMGIIYLKPIIDSFLKFSHKFKSRSQFKVILNQRLKDLSDIISVTLSAQIFTLPIIIYNFGTVSLIAPITNLLILPIVPFLMVFGFLASLFGIFSGFLGWIFALPCYALLIYFLKVLDVFYQSWATKSFENISWAWFLIYYVILLMLIKFLQKKLKPKFLGF